MGGLVDGILKAMCVAKLKVAAVLLMTLSLACLADGLLSRAGAATPMEPKPVLRQEETPPTFGTEPTWQVSRAR